jgi:hypothetical protein
MVNSNRLTPRWRKFLLTIHIASSVGAFGGLVSVAAITTSTLSGADPLTAYRAADLAETAIVIPLALVALASGTALATLSRWGLFRFWWVAIKLVITTALAALASFGLAPHLHEAAALAAAGAPISTAEHVELAMLPAGAAVLLLVNIALSVYKPAARLKRDKATRSPSRRTAVQT